MFAKSRKHDLPDTALSTQEEVDLDAPSGPVPEEHAADFDSPSFKEDQGSRPRPGRKSEFLALVGIALGFFSVIMLCYVVFRAVTGGSTVATFVVPVGGFALALLAVVLLRRSRASEDED